VRVRLWSWLPSYRDVAAFQNAWSISLANIGEVYFNALGWAERRNKMLDTIQLRDKMKKQNYYNGSQKAVRYIYNLIVSFAVAGGFLHTNFNGENYG